MRILATLTTAAAALALTVTLSPAQESVEVIHWWTTGGEAAALEVLKDKLETQDVTWKDAPVAGGGGSAAMTTLRARVVAGNPPSASQMLGYAALDWAEQGTLADLSAVAAEGNWDDLVPKALQDFAKYDGKWIAAPVTLHSANWVFVNKAIMDQLGATEPTNWDELVALLDKAKAAGVIPFAIGGQDFQEANLFESVLLSTGGPGFYRKAMIDLDPEALGSDTMRTVFERMDKMRTYLDPNFSGRDWNLATAMVIRGEALMQNFADSAKGEFKSAGKTPGEDYMCFRFPGTQGMVTFLPDEFVFFNGKDGKIDPAGALMAADILDPGFQSAFNVIKGAAPVRLDVADTAFDLCGKKAIADVQEAAKTDMLLGSMAYGYANPPAVQNAIYDVVTRHFHEEITTDEALVELPDAVAAAQ